jgi:hypothetical protein
MEVSAVGSVLGGFAATPVLAKGMTDGMHSMVVRHQRRYAQYRANWAREHLRVARDGRTTRLI